jgi:CTP:molybdopterin cytidylyltransferase MocA
MINRVDAVVLAGGGTLKADVPAGKKKASAQAGAPPPEAGNKVLLTIGGRPMIDYVTEALRNCPEVGKIVLVGDASLQKAYRQPSGLLFASPGDSPLGSLASGVSVLENAPDAADWILSCTGDIPFLSPGAVSEFLQQCSRREADFYYPITTRQAAESRFPGVKRTYARLRDGVFTGGNLFLVRRSIAGEALPKAGDFIRLRKKPVAMARLVGFGFLLAYLFGFMTIAMAERRISSLVGYRGAAVLSDYPEIGVDVDKISDLDMARRLLAP